MRPSDQVDRIRFLFTMLNNPRFDCSKRETCVMDAAGAPGSGGLVEPDGIEPTTSCLQSTRSPN